MPENRKHTVFVIERLRAGLGAAGVVAVLTEGLASFNVFAKMIGSEGVSTFIVFVLGVVAFLVGTYFTDEKQERIRSK